MPTLHHKYGPSGLASFERCPQFVKREEGEGGAHPVAVEGTMLHSKVELRDVTNLTKDQTTMVENSLAYMDQLTADADSVEQEIMLEICKKDDGTFVSFGTTDLIAHWFEQKKAKMIDWKFGWNTVTHPKDNLQVVCYVVGFFEKYDYCDEIEAHIYMSRYGSGEFHTFKRSDLDDLKLRILTVVDRVESNAPHTPSTQACLYCDIKGTCPAVAGHALALVEEKPFDITKMAGEITDPAQMAKVLQAVELLAPWCDEVKKKAKEMVLGGQPVAGYDVRERASSPSLGSPSAIYETVQNDMTIDEFTEACDVKLTKLKKVVGDKAPRGSKKLAQELLVGKLKGKGLLIEGEKSLVLYKKKKV